MAACLLPGDWSRLKQLLGRNVVGCIRFAWTTESILCRVPRHECFENRNLLPGSSDRLPVIDWVRKRNSDSARDSGHCACSGSYLRSSEGGLGWICSSADFRFVAIRRVSHLGIPAWIFQNCEWALHGCRSSADLWHRAVLRVGHHSGDSRNREGEMVCTNSGFPSLRCSPGCGFTVQSAYEMGQSMKSVKP